MDSIFSFLIIFVLFFLGYIYLRTVAEHQGRNRTHYLSMSGSNPPHVKLYICKICWRNFPSEGRLQKHMGIHKEIDLNLGADCQICKVRPRKGETNSRTHHCVTGARSARVWSEMGRTGSTEEPSSGNTVNILDGAARCRGVPETIAARVAIVRMQVAPLPSNTREQQELQDGISSRCTFCGIISHSISENVAHLNKYHKLPLKEIFTRSLHTVAPER